MINAKEAKTLQNTNEVKAELTSVLPTYKIEYTDGTNWYFLASENLLNMEVKNAVAAATTTNLNATYSNGTAGVGATLTNAGTQAVFSLDSVTLTVGQRVLIKDQTSQLQNGLYTVTNVGSASTNWVLTRTTDYDSLYLINPGDIIEVVGGTVNSISSWMQTAVAPTAIGTSSITFALLSQAKNQITSVVGTTNQITVTTASGVATVSITANPIIPGTAGMTLPGGTTAQRPSTPPAGTLRFNNGS